MNKLRIHLIAIGGSAMHNIALALQNNGHHVTGSDDEIYEPSRSRLEKQGLLPTEMGWNPDRITKDIDIVILGMHARIDNPELLKAQELGLKIYSYPEYIAKASKDKKRVVIAGSHGKTTTTSIIMHTLKYHNVDYDYLVGAQIEGFERMVKLSDAPLIIIEGDEYLSSPMDRRPKMLHYHPHLAVITGIAWDHINVFPTLADYNKQFDLFVDSIEPSGKLFYYQYDDTLYTIVREHPEVSAIGYSQIDVKNNQVNINDQTFDIKLVGKHNYQNINAALLVCQELGISEEQFFEALQSFSGAAKRLQILKEGKDNRGYIYLDFAHAPSKVKATTSAVKEHFGEVPLTAILELHTFSSLNRKFLPTYKNALEKADQAFVFFDEHTLKMKQMPDLSSDYIKNCFGEVTVINNKEDLKDILDNIDTQNSNLLLMSSGKFGGLDLSNL